MQATEPTNFALAAQSFYYALPADRQATVKACLQQAVRLIESGNRELAYPIEVSNEKVFVLRTDPYLRLIVRKSGEVVQLLDIIDKRQVESYLSQAA